ncbi:GLPGLI family protein [Ascidiimonas aurantiaca]|uniref:GLPGLI family protein n=1 Tax=Ascidiimonas aurantiaca TaxID=1685432 RepID=UPI0030EF996A
MIKSYFKIGLYLLACYSFGQDKSIQFNYLANYQLYWQPDSLDVNSKIKTETYSLLFNNNNSFFISSNRLALDTLIFDNKASLNNIDKLIAMPQPTSNKRIYNSVKSDTLTVINEVRGQLFLYKDFVKLKWKLLEGVDSIQGLRVKKATTFFRGREYFAYYSEEIPISFGPYKFSGLPGLIVKIYDTKDHITYNLVAFKPYKKELSLNYVNESSFVSKKEFKKAEEQYRLNPIPYMESQGAVFSEETKRKIKEKFKQRNAKSNNKIELIDR